MGAVTGLLVAAAFVGTSALASSGGTTTPPTTTKPAPSTNCAAPPAGAPAKGPGGPAAGPGPAPFIAAVAQLVQSGTINESQGRILDADIRAGSIDSGALVANGTLSSAQMQAVMERLGAVKRILAPGPDSSPNGPAAAQKRAAAQAQH
jgi:hypothetical protein